MPSHYEERMNILLGICHLPTDFVDVIRTSDGHYLAQRYGDIGFNHFLGKPNKCPLPGTVEVAKKYWNRAEGLAEKKALLRLARRKNIQLRDFLPKEKRHAVPLS